MSLQAVKSEAFKLPKLLVEKGLLLRETVLVPPEQVGTITGGAGSHVIFKIPSDSGRWVYGTRHIAVQFNADGASSGGGGTYQRFENGIKSIIKEVRVFSSGNRILNPLFYNVKAAMEQGLNGDPDSSLIGGMLEGLGTRSDRNTWCEDNLKYVIYVELLPIAKGTKSINILPASFFAGDLKVEIFFEEPSRCMRSDYTTLAYNITNSRMRLDYILPSASLVGEMKALFQTGGFKLPIEERLYYSNPLNSGQTRYELNFAITKESVKKVLFAMRTASTVASGTTDDKLSTFNHNSIQDYQFHVGGYNFPQDVVNTTSANCAEAMFELLRCSDNFTHYDEISMPKGSLNRLNWLESGCLLGYNFSKNPLAPVMGGISTGSSGLRLVLNFSSALGSNQQIELFSYSDMVLKASPSGVLQIVDPSSA